MSRKPIREVKPRVLTFDIETAPFEVYSWGLNDQYLNVSQMKTPRSVLSFAAKWLGEKVVTYFGTGSQRDVRDDKGIMQKLWRLLDEADVIITQNGKRFDEPIVRGRFLVHGLGLPSPYKHIDTCQLAKKLGLPSTKLEFLASQACPELPKLKHKRFPGQDLWTECLAGNRSAWKEMEAYNKRDVEATERVYKWLQPFGTNVNFNLFHDRAITVCNCGSTDLRNKGYVYTASGKFQSYRCQSCGLYHKSKENLFSKEKRASLKGAV
jgi:hypothetical protein